MCLESRFGTLSYRCEDSEVFVCELYDFMSPSVWLSNTSDFNPMDYLMLAVVEKTLTTFLITQLIIIMRLFLETTTCAKFMIRVDSVVDAHSDFCEWFCFNLHIAFSFFQINLCLTLDQMLPEQMFHYIERKLQSIIS